MARKIRQLGILGGLSVIALTAGCSTTVTLPSTELPDALVDRYPLSVAVRYDEALADYTYSEQLATGERISIGIGQASQAMFSKTFSDMFDRVVIVPSGERPPDEIDLLVEPSIFALEFALPSQTVTNDYAVWIKYRLKIYDASGQEQADYAVSAYGKAARESLMAGTKSALTSASELALRDAAVLLLTRFEKEANLLGRQLPDVSLVDVPPEIDASTPLPPVGEAESTTTAEQPNSEQYL